MSLLGGAYAASTSSSDDDEARPAAPGAPLVAYGGASDSEGEEEEEGTRGDGETARGVKRARAAAEAAEAHDGAAAAAAAEPAAAEEVETVREAKRVRRDVGPVDEDFWRRPVPDAPPSSECAASVRARVAKFKEMRGEGIMLNAERRKSKAFRNPSILTQLVDSLGLDAHASNLARAVFDPKGVPEGEFYDALLRR